MPRLTLERTKWFDYPEDEFGAKIEIKHLKPGKLQEIEAKVNRFTGKMGDGDSGFTTELDINPFIRKQEIIKAAIVNWDKFFDHTGKECKCTDKVKLAFLKEIEDFYEVVEKMREDLAAEVNKEMEGSDPN